MAHESDPGFRVLHTMRCIGTAGEERVAEASGLSLQEARSLLSGLSGNGLVGLAPGPFGGWALTDEGRAAEEEMLRVDLERSGMRGQVHYCYRRFLDLNPALLQVCTDWQMRRLGQTPLINDHTDRDYDNGVLSRLIRIDDRAQAACDDLGGLLTRFGTYGGRFTIALNRALAGDAAWVADTINSYHSVWFQLHEDLLTTLGLSRSDNA